MLVPRPTLLLLLLPLIRGQNFDPNMEDGQYLKETSRNSRSQVTLAEKELLERVNGVKEATKGYIEAKIKDNMFQAIKTVAEKELEASMDQRPRQPRQDEEEDDESTTEAGLIPQLAGVVQSIFGNNVNVTKYVESASKLLPRPIGGPLVGVASLLDPNQFTSTSTVDPEDALRITARPDAASAPPKVPEGGSNNGNSSATPTQASNSTKAFPDRPIPLFPSSTRRRKPTPSRITGAEDEEGGSDEADEEENDVSNNSTDEEEDEEEEDRRRRGALRRVKRQSTYQLKGLNPMVVLDGLETLWSQVNRPNNVTAELPKPLYSRAPAPPSAPASASATSAPKRTNVKPVLTDVNDDLFDDDFTTRPSRVTSAVNGAASRLEQFRKGVPNLFEGVREAYKFLQQLNGFLDTWEGRLQAATAAVDD